MAYKITDACVACGTCIGECPVEAISAGDIYVIASLGQTPAQVPQSMHLSASIT